MLLLVQGAPEQDVQMPAVAAPQSTALPYPAEPAISQLPAQAQHAAPKHQQHAALWTASACSPVQHGRDFVTSHAACSPALPVNIQRSGV